MSYFNALVGGEEVSMIVEGCVSPDDEYIFYERETDDESGILSFVYDSGSKTTTIKGAKGDIASLVPVLLGAGIEIVSGPF